MKKPRKTLLTKKWKRFREYVMSRDNYLCQESLRFGKTVQAEMVHHIYPVRDYPELEFVSWNCISLSNFEHNKFHNRKSDEITQKGKNWQKRRKEEFENFFKKNIRPPHQK